jgi:hypothetical protein
MSETDILAIWIAAGRRQADYDEFYSGWFPPDMTCEEALEVSYEEWSESLNELVGALNEIIRDFHAWMEEFGKALTPVVAQLATSLGAFADAYISALPWYRRWWIKVRMALRSLRH